MIVEELGRIKSPLRTVRLAGETRLIVSPWAALGTDTLLVGVSTALLFSTKSGWLKVVSLLGGAWGVTAITLEVAKLVSE